MITGVHAIIYSADAERDRTFFRDVMEWQSVDAHRGWLIFALPPAELAVHPAELGGQHELYLMCDDIAETVRTLESRGVKFTGPIADEGWGLLTAFLLPSGGEVGIYQPKHPTAIAGGR